MQKNKLPWPSQTVALSRWSFKEGSRSGSRSVLLDGSDVHWWEHLIYCFQQVGHGDLAGGAGLLAGFTDLGGTPADVQAASCISREGCYLREGSFHFLRFPCHINQQISCSAKKRKALLRMEVSLKLSPSWEPGGSPDIDYHRHVQVNNGDTLWEMRHEAISNIQVLCKYPSALTQTHMVWPFL